MRISWNNLLKIASLSATNENLNYPASCLYHNYLEYPFYATDDNSVITAIFDDDNNIIDHVAYGYHNLNSMVLAFYDALNNLLDTITVNPIESGEGVQYFEEITDVKKVTITVDTLTPLLYIGFISIGEFLQMPNPIAGEEETLTIGGTSQQSGGGQVSGNRLKNLAVKPFHFVEFSDTIKQEIDDYLTTCGISITHLVDVCENDHDYKKPFFASIVSAEIARTQGRKARNLWNMALTFKQAR